MRLVLVLVHVTLLLAGCSEPYERPGAATAPDPSARGAPEGPTPVEEAPERLVDGGNEHVRVSLDDHRVVGQTATLFVTLENKDDSGVKRTKYAHLGTTAGTVYFDLVAAIDAGTTRRFELEGSGDEGVARAGWTGLTIFYTEDGDEEYDSDEAVLLDLSGRGLPRNVS